MAAVQRSPDVPRLGTRNGRFFPPFPHSPEVAPSSRQDSSPCYRPPMPRRAIVLYPDPVLLTPTREVEAIDDEIRTLVSDMIETMYAAPGIGLAANQVG